MGEDLSGNGNDAALDDVTLAEGPFGVRDTAYRFHGRATSYGRISSSSSMNVGHNGSFTFTAFIRTDLKMVPFLEYRGDNGYGLHIWAYPSEKLYINVMSGVTRTSNFNNVMDVSVNDWHFVGVSYDINAQTLMGVVDENSEVVPGFVVTRAATEGDAYLGLRVGSPGLLGEMSCVMLFSVGLSLDDVQRVKEYCGKHLKPRGKKKINIKKF